MAELAAAICEHRLRKEWSQARLGKEVALTKYAISHFESGRHVPRRDVARRIDEALDAGGSIWMLRDELDDSPDAERVRRYARLEKQASTIRLITGFVPALLETDEHTRLALESGLPVWGGELEDKVKYRAARREAFRAPDAPTLRVVLGEAALHIVTGGSGVMRRQLLHLLERSHQANVDLRVLPFRGSGFFADVGTVTLWERPKGRDVAYRIGARSGTYLTRQADVDDFGRLYDHMRGVALNQEASRDLIRTVLEESYPCLLSAPTGP
ncbi:helix-turn-helix domain-containing protein [Streptomyces gamaensis]|uniref:helix-turn-helix domain-containing protein n=1 Tax=Streptomyces gamaensis TaxID=1763542 RepID=UPI0036F1BA6C